MQNTTSRKIEIIVNGFKGFNSVNLTKVDELASQYMANFPVTSIQQGPSRIGGKFVAKHFILSFHWKLGVAPESFPTLQAAQAAQEAYEIQNKAGIQCRQSLLMDQMRAKALETINHQRQDWNRIQRHKLASATRADALKDLSRL